VDGVTRIPDGHKSFVDKPGFWRRARYEGEYRDGLRDGLWRVTDAESGEPLWEVTWMAGEWHGPARGWYPRLLLPGSTSPDCPQSGGLEYEGEYAYGQATGRWTFWFQNGQTAATGRYANDRKIGDWRYWDDQGRPMSYDDWSRSFEEYDWAYDDYSGTPRGENWPEPPQEGDDPRLS
jgi:hypothetical protein